MRANSVIPDDVKQRAATRYEKVGDCHISTYSRGSHGYAQIGWQIKGSIVRKNAGTTAHRAAWEYHNGPIPDDMTIDHTCKKRPCVNVAHMRLLSNYENARRTAGRDWELGFCVNGHSNENLYRQPKGKRICRLCNVEAQARYRRKQALKRAGLKAKTG